jgi:hypothetical protein
LLYSTNIQKGNFMTKRISKLWIVLALLVSCGGQAVIAETIELKKSQLWIEINDTDGDSGLQMFLDTEDWKRVKIIAPAKAGQKKGKTIFQAVASGAVSRTGLTELSFESSEPGFDELPWDEFLARFPEGTYKFKGTTKGGDKVVGEAVFSHIVPAAPVVNYPAENETVSKDNLVITWNPVTTQWTPPGSAPVTEPITITKYELVIVESDDKEDPRKLSILLAPDVTSCSIPSAFFESGSDYKLIFMGFADNGNRTQIERTFKTAAQ